MNIERKKKKEKYVEEDNETFAVLILWLAFSSFL